IPDTTPMANETAKILVQNRARRWRCSRPVAIQRTSKVAMKAESPMVKLGKMMWKVIVKANWRRASRTGSRSIGHPRRLKARIVPWWRIMDQIGWRNLDRRDRSALLRWAAGPFAGGL